MRRRGCVGSSPDLCCHPRSCQTDVQCKEACKCWVSLECEDPPKTMEEVSAKPARETADYAQNKEEEEVDEEDENYEEDVDEKEEQEDVQDSSMEKTHVGEGYQNAVSITLFSC